MAKGKKKKDEAKAESQGNTGQQSSDADFTASKLSADALIAKMLKNFQADAIPDTIRENLLRCVQEAQASGLDASLFAGVSDLANSSDSSGMNETKDQYSVPNGSFAEMSEALQYSSQQYSHADNRSIHVGWQTSGADSLIPNAANTDSDIASVCKLYGTFGYNFICYPIGGTKRSLWKPTSGENPPPVDLPDIQLQSQLWQTYVNGRVSPWIDPDHESEFIAKLSEEALEEELEYCTYMGLRSIVIELKHAQSPRLAAIVKRWLWERCARFTFWIMVRTNSEYYTKDENLDVWSIWANFRNACDNFTSAKIVVGFVVTLDLGEEFVVPSLYSRWKGEPLSVFWFDSDVFIMDSSTNAAILSPAHATLLSDLWYSSCQRILISAQNRDLFTPHLVPALARAVRTIVGPRMMAVEENSNVFGQNRQGVDPSIADFVDTLQAPLQPLSDTLDSTIYETFEQDAIKYIQYRKAMSKALSDIFERNPSIRERPLVIMVLGAGRGPLVTAALEAFDLLQKTVAGASRVNAEVYAVEKNKCACVTLRYCNQTRWKGVVKVINGDMRELGDLHKRGEIKSPDLMVSELIGSFGDNELSPECLDGVTPIIRKDTISIPQSYRSYVVPIHSVRLQQSVVQLTPDYWTARVPQKGRNQKAHGIPTDRIYVVCLRGFHPLGIPQVCFEFKHPNFEGKSNARSKRLTFRFTKHCEVMGFAGYFEATLYDDIMLGTVPGHETKSLVSWFPALIPLREMLRVHDGMRVTFCIERKLDDKGTWYEWNVEYEDPTSKELVKTVVQNENAHSDYMKLYTAFDAMLYMLLP